MKKKLQKVFSLLLTFSLLMSMMSVSVFATGSESATSAQQIVTNGQETSYADGKVKVSKMISGTNTENVFDITLSVETTQSYDTVIVTPPAAVALVIDTSASMDAQVSGVEDGRTVTRTRLYWAQKAAVEFLEEFADPNGAARYVSLSEFYQYGFAKSSNGKYWFNVSDEAERAVLAGLINSLIYRDHYGTNVEAGLLMAEDLLNDSPVKDLEHKFLLLLSDGAPNAVSTAMPSGGYVAGEYNGTYNNNPEWDKTKYDSLSLFDDWAGYSGGGKEIYVPGNTLPDGSEEHEDKVDTMDNDGYYMGWYWKKTATKWEKVEMTGYSNPYLYAAYRAYKAAQDIGATIPVYTINYGSAGEQIGANETNWNFSTNYSVGDWLKYHIASKPGNAFGSGDSDDVAELFTSILGEIKEELAKYAQAWTVTDPMGERVEYIANSAATNDGSVSCNNGTLIWTLADPSQRVDGNKTYYTYGATYQVKLDNVTPGSDSLAAFAEGKAYATNGTTTLTYWLMVDENGNQYYVDESGAKVTGDPTLTADFVVPSVKGYLADLTFKKVNEENEALAGAVFTLSGANSFSQEATSDENGYVSFTNIPSGYSYTLSEKTAPDGYDKTESTYTVTVSYDTVSVAGVSDLSNFQIANQKTYVPVPPKHTITATKAVDGATLEADQFSFQLLDSQGNVLQTKTNAADGSVTFDEIDYADAGVGTYTYTVKEFVPASVPENWTYDSAEHTVIVVVSKDAATGEYSKTVTVNGVENGPISFTNSYYEPQHERGSITVTKVTNGNTTPADAKFQLEKKVGENNWAAVGDPVLYSAFVANAETGAMEYTFSNLAKGTYHVVETNADSISNYSWGVSYSGNVELVETSVGDKGDTQVSSGAITVTNTYTEHKGSLKISKTITGLSDAQKATLAEKLVFTVTGPNNYNATVAYKDFSNGTYHVINNLSVGTYEVTENVGEAQVDGYHLAYTYNNNSSAANASAQVQNDKTDEATIANVYTELPPTSVSGQFSINFGKAVSGDDYTLAGNDFAFNLTDSSNNVITGYNAANGSVSINVPFAVDLAGVTGNTTTRTFTYTLSEQAGSVEGMTYSTAQYPVSVVVTFSRTSNLSAWTWAVTDVTVTGAEDSISNAAITLNLAGGAKLFTNIYDEPVYTGTLTIEKVIEGDLTDAEMTELANKLDFVVNKVFEPQPYGGGGNAYILYTSMTDGAWVMNDQKPGTYTVTENDSAMDGYTLSTTWTVTGTDAKTVTDSSAQVALKAGDDITVTITNTYSKIPVYTYYVEHEYLYKVNGGEYVSQGKNTPVAYTTTNTSRPSEAVVFGNQVASEGYNGTTYTKAAEYADSEVYTNNGKLTDNTLVYTVKYYASGWTVGGLTINKNISGLDESTLKTLKSDLSFTVKNSAGETVETVAYDADGVTLSGLAPDTYTILENNAEVGGGYDLAVTASDADAQTPGYQVTVTAGSAPVTFNITNTYTSRVYNIWFDGAEHGIVYNTDNTVYRHRWMEFSDADNDASYYEWSGFGLKASDDTLYQLGSTGTDKIYIGVTEENDPAISKILGDANNTRNMVMYTFTWKEYMEYVDSMKISKPALTVDKGWVSDKEFYHNGGETRFENLEKTLAAMNGYIDGVAVTDESGSTVQPVYVDGNGYYHIYYAAKYTQYQTPTGSLTINKIATGAEVPAGATFTISGTTVDQEAYTTSFTYQDMTEGTKTITIPAGTYIVTETGANVSGYTLTTTVNYGEGATSAAVVANETAVVSITNAYTFNGGGGGGGTIIIPEPPVPLAPVPQPEPEPEVEEIPEEEVPLADIPKTGDASALWMMMSILSGTSLAGVTFLGRKKHEA